MVKTEKNMNQILSIETDLLCLHWEKYTKYPAWILQQDKDLFFQMYCERFSNNTLDLKNMQIPTKLLCVKSAETRGDSVNKSPNLHGSANKSEMSGSESFMEPITASKILQTANSVAANQECNSYTDHLEK